MSFLVSSLHRGQIQIHLSEPFVDIAVYCNLYGSLYRSYIVLTLNLIAIKITKREFPPRRKIVHTPLKQV